MISEINAFSNIRSSEQCTSISFEDTCYDDFMSKARGNSSYRSIAKHRKQNDDDWEEVDY